MDDIIIGTTFADKKGEIMIVKLKGYIDQTNSFGLQKAFNDILTSGCYKIIVDFAKVLYISSAGWGIFVGEIKRFRDESGDIKLANMTPDIYEVYQMLEFYHIFEDYNSTEDATKSFVELEIGQNNSSAISHNSEQTLEIELNEDPGNEQLDDNILNISIGNSDNELTDDPEALNQDIEELSDDIEIKLDESFNSDNTEEDDLTQAGEHTTYPTKEYTPPVLDLSQLPLHEKIKKLVAEYPLLNIFQMKKLLKDDRFGTVKINVFKLYKALKSLDFETKLKRFRYYRSC